LFACSDKMNTELMVEHLGFTPVQFVDEVLNMVNETMYKSMSRFERIVETQAGIQETEQVLLIETGDGSNRNSF
jgi:CO dehydrogenase nickel-insertion accessory protein CooC1